MGEMRRGAVLVAVAAALALLPQPAATDAASARVTGGAQASAVSFAFGAPAAAAPLVSAVPEVAEPTAVDCARVKCVALTFDDGPSPYTLEVLRSLQKAGARATFFVVGENTAQRPAVVKAVADAGMVVGDHSWDHREYTRLTAKQQRWETKSTARAIVAAGAPKPTLFRPPFGSYDRATRKLGMPIILWDVDPEDWKTRSTAKTTRRVLAGARAGSIVLLHDIWPSTVKAVPAIIKGLQKKGYTLVTLPELLGTTRAGTVYTDRRR